MTEAAGAVACGCDIHHLAVTVRIFAENKNQIKKNGGSRSKKKKQIAAKTKKNGQDMVKDGTIIREDLQATARFQEQKASKMLDEPYQDILPISETVRISLFKCKTDTISVSMR